MIAAPPLSVSARFSADMVELRKVLFRHCMWFGQPVLVVMLVMDYLRRADARFARLFERFYAGTLALRLRKPGPRPKSAAVKLAAGEMLPDKPKQLPRAFGWLCKLIRPDGYLYADRLRVLLADPETEKLLAAGPQAGRLLRPLCKMFGIKDERLALPKRPRAAKPATPAQAERQAEREEARRQRELAKTSSKKSVVPKGHTYPVTEREWAIWARRNRRNERRWRTAKWKRA